MKDIQQYELVEGLRNGEETAYKELYRLHYKVLCAFAYSYVNNSFIAESLVSDVIFNLWEGRGTLTINQSLRAYLMKAVKNTCINYLAHCSRHNDLLQTLSGKLTSEQQTYYNQDGHPLCSLLEKELEEQIEKSISSLSELSREIFWMSRNDKMKYEEIARQKGLTVDIVKYHIRLVLSKLRKDLKDYLFTFLFIFFPF
ncbi:RNA polymerase sigma-70 factor [Parabacteroides chinchillae]|uniref:RNA polymerase sigma-70 factor, ECF subfamily n=1 Tax=Parabacteroides chinchillae TaxID=871327 RepID=A0A8G2BXW4_9BACT|nr:RNA polymerase sigma-70 factor [Parabacteroides chinchillae]SEG10866.1 RNA polymerase sigma-70 factor, ECF subfamily [Parabacteroides chinchillae]